jgi:hypothetical protein
MDNIPILIYSHTDYIDILEPCIKKFHKFHPELNYILAINRIDEIDSLGITNLFSSIYTYDDTTPYFTRLTNVLNQINYKYIILNNDTNILVDKINIEYLKYIVTHMEYDNIDQFRLFPSGVDPIITSQNFFEITSGYYFSVATGLWKKESLLKITCEFKEHGYRCAECEPIQSYVKNNFKNYCVFSNEDIQLVPHGHYLPKMFPVLHVTCCKKWSFSSSIEQKYINEISKEYNIDLNVRGFKYIDEQYTLKD